MFSSQYRLALFALIAVNMEFFERKFFPKIRFEFMFINKAKQHSTAQ